MHCYNCGKNIKSEESSISLDGINYSHTECLLSLTDSETENFNLKQWELDQHKATETDQNHDYDDGTSHFNLSIL